MFLTDTHLSENNIEVIKSIFRQAIHLAKEYGFKKIFHLGDIFHSRKGQPQEVLSVFDDILDEFESNGIVLVVISGNHDRADYTSWKSFLKSYKKHPGIDLILHPKHYKLNDDIILHMLPFFEDEVYLKELSKMQSELPFGKKTILGTHIGIAGATMNNGTPVSSTIVPAYFKQYTVVLVGHYHDAQEFENIRYIGASTQHNFGESENKGALLLYDDLSMEILPLEFPKYLTFQVDVNEITLKDVSDIKEEKSNSGNFIRTIVTGKGKDIKSFAHRKALIDAGIKVETREDKIDKEELDGRIEPFDDKSLKQEFEIFCEKNELNILFGNKYFNKAII